MRCPKCNKETRLKENELCKKNANYPRTKVRGFNVRIFRLKSRSKERGFAPQRLLSNKCFLKYVEKKIRKEIRTKNIFSKGNKILILDGLSYYLIKKIVTIPIDIVKENIPLRDIRNIRDVRDIEALFLKHSNVDKMIVPFTMDDKNNALLSSFMLKDIMLNKDNKATFPKKVFSIFESMKEADLERFANINRIKTSFLPKNQVLQAMINRLEKRLPNIRNAIAKSAEGFAKI